MKTININGIEMKLTNERTRRIVESIIEAQGKLNKELAYSEDLQKKNMIEFYRNHIAKLEGLLS